MLCGFALLKKPGHFGTVMKVLSEDLFFCSFCDLSWKLIVKGGKREKSCDDAFGNLGRLLYSDREERNRNFVFVILSLTL